MAKKSNSLNYSKNEFAEKFGFSPKVFDDCRKKWCQAYDFDNSRFKSFKEENGNIEIQYEYAPLLALFLHTFREHPLYRANGDISKTTLTDIVEYNNLVLKEIHKLPEYLKNSILNNNSFCEIYRMHCFLPCLLKYVAMLFSTIIKFHSNWAHEPFSQLIDEMYIWSINFFVHHNQLTNALEINKTEKEKRKKKEKSDSNSGYTYLKGIDNAQFYPIHQKEYIINCTQNFEYIGVGRMCFSTFDGILLKAMDCFRTPLGEEVESDINDLVEAVEDDSFNNSQNSESLRKLRLQELNKKWKISSATRCQLKEIEQVAENLANYYLLPMRDIGLSKNQLRPYSDAQQQYATMFENLERTPESKDIMPILDLYLGQLLIGVMADDKEGINNLVKKGPVSPD